MTMNFYYYTNKDNTLIQYEIGLDNGRNLKSLSRPNNKKGNVLNKFTSIALEHGDKLINEGEFYCANVLLDTTTTIIDVLTKLPISTVLDISFKAFNIDSCDIENAFKQTLSIPFDGAIENFFYDGGICSEKCFSKNDINPKLASKDLINIANIQNHKTFADKHASTDHIKLIIDYGRKIECSFKGIGYGFGHLPDNNNLDLTIPCPNGKITIEMNEMSSHTSPRIAVNMGKAGITCNDTSIVTMIQYLEKWQYSEKYDPVIKTEYFVSISQPITEGNIAQTGGDPLSSAADPGVLESFKPQGAKSNVGSSEKGLFGGDKDQNFTGSEVNTKIASALNEFPSWYALYLRNDLDYDYDRTGHEGEVTYNLGLYSINYNAEFEKPFGNDMLNGNCYMTDSASIINYTVISALSMILPELL